MERYDYETAVRDDVRTYIDDYIDFDDWKGKRDELEEKLNDDLWIEDSVTGNASGSYTFSTWTAEEYICHNMDLVGKAYDEFCSKPDWTSAESMDVTVRCYLLGGAIHDVLDELEDDGEFDDDDESEEDEE